MSLSRIVEANFKLVARSLERNIQAIEWFKDYIFSSLSGF